MATINSTVYVDDYPIVHSIQMPNGNTIDIADIAVRDRVSDILQRLTHLESQRQVEFIELSCKNCGGKIQQKYHDPIFKCPYCKTVYAIGIKQVNSV